MEFVNWIFFGPSMLVAGWTYAGLSIAVILIGAQAWLSWRKVALFRREFFREAPVFAGLLWAIFNLYEHQFAATVGRSAAGGALRMDLIILVPILYVLTFAALASIFAQLRNKPDVR